MKAKIVWIFLILLCSELSCFIKTDSLTFLAENTADYSSYSGNLNFDKELSSGFFRLNGASKLTIYEKDKKSFSSLNSTYGYYFSDFGFGLKTYGKLWYDETIAIPDENNFYILPLVLHKTSFYNFKAGAGYANKKNDTYFKDGLKFLIEADFSTINQDRILPQILAENEDWSVSVKFAQDDLDSLKDFNFNLKIDYLALSMSKSMNFFVTGLLDRSIYNYYNSANSQNYNESFNYNINAKFDYKLSKYLRNNFGFELDKLHKEGYSNSVLYKNNEVIKLRFSEELNLSIDNWFSLFSFSFLDGGDNFYLNQNKDNYKDFAYNLRFQTLREAGKHQIGFSGSYYKYSYLSQNENKLNDHDIQAISLIPSYSLLPGMTFFFVDQQLKLYYYHLVNIDAAKSSSNLKEKSLQSVTNFVQFPYKDLKNSTVIDLKTSYNIYDYAQSSAYITSYTVKKWQGKDSLSYKFTPNSLGGMFLNYTFEEFSFYDDVKNVEDPQTFQKKYHGGFFYEFSYKMRAYNRLVTMVAWNEFYYFEIDNFFCLSDDKYILSGVSSYYGIKSEFRISNEIIKSRLAYKYHFKGRNAEAGFQRFELSISYIF